jgi:hypothetical protein
MKLRIEQAQIRNLRNHPIEDVEALRRLLTSGAAARLDPHRKNFYEVDNGSRVFYVHVTPATTKVMFLAVWYKAQPASCEMAEEPVLAACGATP